LGYTLRNAGIAFLKFEANVANCDVYQTLNSDAMKEDKNKTRKGQENENESKEPYENKPLPGEYPPSEDIMNRLNEVERISIDPDNLTRTPGASNEIREERTEPTVFPPSTNTHKAATGESNLTKEDFEALGPRDLSLDGGDDEQLKHRVYPVDFAARDLDVPNGDDERLDALGQGDEENDHYSLGGDDKENLEEDPTRTLG